MQPRRAVQKFRRYGVHIAPVKFAVQTNNNGLHLTPVKYSTVPAKNFTTILVF